MGYAVSLMWDNSGSAYVAIPDFPAILNRVANRDDALGHAKDAIETAVAAAMRASEDIPWPDARGDDFVALSALSDAKIKLYRTIRAEGVAPYELAKRIGVTPSRISRLFDLRHHSRIDKASAPSSP